MGPLRAVVRVGSAAESSPPDAAPAAEWHMENCVSGVSQFPLTAAWMETLPSPGAESARAVRML